MGHSILAFGMDHIRIDALEHSHLAGKIEAQLVARMV